MNGEYYRLECRIQRWNTTLPAVFLIDGTHPSFPTAVFNRKTHESLDNKKGRKPRPLKTHAYNFSLILDEHGNPIIRNRATDAATAEDFARRILAAAKPVERRAYLQELDMIRWPGADHADPGPEPDGPVHPRLTPGQAGLEFIAARSCGWLPEAPEGPRAGDKRVSARKLLLRELTDLLERMDEEDLEALLKFARTLAE